MRYIFLLLSVLLASACQAQQPEPEQHLWVRFAGDTIYYISPPHTFKLTVPDSIPEHLREAVTEVVRADTMIMVVRGDSAVMVRPGRGAPVSAEMVKTIRQLAEIERRERRKP